MNGHANGTASQLPEEMFTIVKHASNTAPRLGRLAISGRKIIETPHYLAHTSRGVIPHITQDTFARDTNISGVYVALEDFVEKAPYAIPPIYAYRPLHSKSPLRDFISLPHDSVLVLGARRSPPVEAPPQTSNTNDTVAICTANGFRYLEQDAYARETEELKGDILVGLGDIPYGRVLANKRIQNATDRMIQWLQNNIAVRKAMKLPNQAHLFASLLPVSCGKQRYYIEELDGRMAEHVDGLAVYDLETLGDLPEQLHHLPRLAFTTPTSPQQILHQIRGGVDVLVVPFIGAATDSGIALDFSFATSAGNSTDGEDATSPRPLGIDMWSEEHAVDVSPLSHGCQCYACANHHRAYIQHLLTAKEMLGWVLLQIHNHHVVDRFFAGIRQSVANDTFDKDVSAFEKKYEPELPEKTGQGPRVRGYQQKSLGRGEAKINRPAFQNLEGKEEKLDDATLPSAGADADDLENQGFAEKEKN